MGRGVDGKPNFLNRAEAWHGCPVRQEDELIGLSNCLAGPISGLIVGHVDD